MDETFLPGAPGTHSFFLSSFEKTQTIESNTPQGGRVTLTVTPERVELVEPNDACMSLLVPDAAAVQKDVVAAFCHFVHFFPSRQAGESWTAKRSGTFLLSMEDAYAFARRKNELQYPAVLG